MLIASILLMVFLLAFYSFAFGWELGCRSRQNQITPRSVIDPKFRLIWSNPQKPHQKQFR